MMQIIALIRVKHWVKNFFVFIPAFFAGAFFDLGVFIVLVAGFISFSCVASFIYVINDYKDVNEDRNHPEKRNRPLASGTVSVPTAFVIAFFLIVFGISLAYYVNPSFMWLLLIYLGLNMGYAFGLKNISILDILIVASGFLLRAIGGGIIAGVAVSSWLLIMIFLLALFMALAKRLDDLVNEKEGKISRKSAKHYNLNFIHSGIAMIAGVIMVSYIMYTLSEEVVQRLQSEHLYVTGVFVVAGLLRYLQISLVEMKSGSPTKIFLTDKFIIITVLGWILSFATIIYLNYSL